MVSDIQTLVFIDIPWVSMIILPNKVYPFKVIRHIFHAKPNLRQFLPIVFLFKPLIRYNIYLKAPFSILISSNKCWFLSTLSLKTLFFFFANLIRTTINIIISTSAIPMIPGYPPILLI